MEKIITFMIDFIEKHYHQKRIVKFLSKFNIKTIFDVGAHKGEFLQSVKEIGMYEKIYSFEPQKNIFNQLKLLSKPNKILCFNFAIGKVNEKKILKINKKTSTSTFSEIDNSSLWYKFKSLNLRGSTKSSFLYYEQTQVFSLDDFCESHKISYIDLLKIDTEGHEKEVLEGASKLIKDKKIKYLLLEFHLSKMYKNYNVEKIEKYLNDLNFRLIKKYKFPFLSFEDRVYSIL